MLPAVGNDLFPRRLLERRDDEGGNLLTALLVRYSNDTHFGNTIHRSNGLFDLVWINVETAHQNHVLLAVDDGEVSVLVHLSDVSGVEPTVDNSGLGLVFSLPVALHDLRALGHKFSGFALLHWLSVFINTAHECRWHRDANRADFHLSTKWVEGDNWRRFGKAVTLNNWSSGYLLPLRGYRFVQRHAACGRGHKMLGWSICEPALV